jgi:hypothetical protein
MQQECLSELRNRENGQAASELELRAQVAAVPLPVTLIRPSRLPEILRIESERGPNAEPAIPGRVTRGWSPSPGQ